MTENNRQALFTNSTHAHRQPQCMGQLPNGERCQNVGEFKVSIANRGGRSGYLCSHCALHQHSYFEQNKTHRGTVKADPWTITVELELHGVCREHSHGATIKGYAELMQKGYIKTSDSTVTVEMKSPIYEGFNSVMACCNKTIQRLLDSRDISIDSECGTHLHIGHREFINSQTMQYLRDYHLSLFQPLEKAILEDEEIAADLFGRSLGYWADRLTNDPWTHTNFINLQHDETVEFRIMFFDNAKQYTHAVRFCRDLMACVINNFIVHYPNLTDEKRLHKANVTAKKIVKLYKKYTEQ